MTTPTRAPESMTFSTADLATRAIHRRAVETLIWGIPAVNFDLMYQSHVRDAKAPSLRVRQLASEADP